MARGKSITSTLIEAFWKFVEDNPKLAAALAFEAGTLAGTFVKNGKPVETLKKQAHKGERAVADLADKLPDSLKFVRGPKIQPRKRRQPARSSRNKQAVA